MKLNNVLKGSKKNMVIVSIPLSIVCLVLAFMGKGNLGWAILYCIATDIAALLLLTDIRRQLFIYMKNNFKLNKKENKNR